MGTSEEIFKTEVKNGFLAGYSLGEKFFESTPPNGFSHWEKVKRKNSIKTALFALSRWLLFGGIFENHSKRALSQGVCKEIVHISENTY